MNRQFEEPIPDTLYAVVAAMHLHPNHHKVFRFFRSVDNARRWIAEEPRTRDGALHGYKEPLIVPYARTRFVPPPKEKR